MESVVRLTACLLFSSIIGNVLASAKVPVLVWTNDRSVAFPQQLVGHSINLKDFRKSFVEDLTSDVEKNVILFLQDKLSVSDFTRFSDVYSTSGDQDSFKNVKSLMSEMTSTYLPSVALPATALLEVRQHQSRKVLVVDDPHDVSLSSSDESHLIIVKLPESRDSFKSLSRLDKVIGMLTMQLKALSRPFVAFYTAEKAATQGSSIETLRHSRRLMSSNIEATGTFVNLSDSFYLYSNNITISVNLSTMIIPGLQLADSESECNSTGDCIVVLKFDDMTDADFSIYNGNIKFQFNRTLGTATGFWYLSHFELSYHKELSSSDMITVEYDTNFVYQTPFGFSYHCSDLPAIRVRNMSNSLVNPPMIHFDNFQVQAFGIKNSQFGHYNDCVGFFTVGIWMFLICAVVLLAVLFYGIIMLLNVTTMDRYDDAKGKTISVNVAD